MQVKRIVHFLETVDSQDPISNSCPIPVVFRRLEIANALSTLYDLLMEGNVGALIASNLSEIIEQEADYFHEAQSIFRRALFDKIIEGFTDFLSDPLKLIHFIQSLAFKGVKNLGTKQWSMMRWAYHQVYANHTLAIDEKLESLLQRDLQLVTQERELIIKILTKLQVKTDEPVDYETMTLLQLLDCLDAKVLDYQAKIQVSWIELYQASPGDYAAFSLGVREIS